MLFFSHGYAPFFQAIQPQLNSLRMFLLQNPKGPGTGIAAAHKNVGGFHVLRLITFIFPQMFFHISLSCRWGNFPLEDSLTKALPKQTSRLFLAAHYRLLHRWWKQMQTIMFNPLTINQHSLERFPVSNFILNGQIKTIIYISGWSFKHWEWKIWHHRLGWRYYEQHH